MELTTDIFSQFDKKWGLLTAGKPGDFNTMTVSWGGLGTLWGKPVATVYVRTSRYTHEFMDREEYFTVSFYPEEYKKTLGVLGSKSGRDMDKMNASGLTPEPIGDSMTFGEAELTLVCRKLFCQQLDVKNIPSEIADAFYEKDAAHDMYIGEVVEIFPDPANNNRCLSQSLLRVAEKMTYGTSALKSTDNIKISRIDPNESDEKRYTLEDYYQMPDSPGVELMDGQIHMMGAPSLVHQQLIISFARQIADFIDKNGKPCTVYVAPTDVQPDAEDDTTILQPDVFVTCDKKREENGKRVIGAPEWIIEILSPSGRRYDQVDKKDKYGQVGVKEYWMVDPETAIVSVTSFEDDHTVHNYKFEKKIPVILTNGALEIDLSRFI